MSAIETIVVDLKNAVDRCDDVLSDLAKIHIIEHPEVERIADGQLPIDLKTTTANLYVLWGRKRGAAEWKPLYVGQRLSGACPARLTDHLFCLPKKRESKLEKVKALVRLQYEFGVTIARVEPDSARLAIEEEIINRWTPTTLDLPWNEKGRKAKRYRELKHGHVELPWTLALEALEPKRRKKKWAITA